MDGADSAHPAKNWGIRSQNIEASANSGSAIRRGEGKYRRVLCGVGGSLPYIRERTWHPSQQIETEPDGSIILALHVADLGEVKFWLIGFGAEAEVLEPAELRDDVKAECLGVVQRVNPIRGGGA
jgi:hypothetical protein